ncbi:MAG: helix-turn-helix domain-containing protein [Cyanobacteria bacterium J06621_15]
MTVNLGTKNELWDLEPPSFLPRSRLFHLLPIGVGTPYVESLTSYVSRLAVAHSVSTGTLLAIEVGPLIKTNYSANRKSIVAIYGQESVRALNGIRLGALQLVRALETLTLRTDLQFLTMLPWTEVFPALGLLKHEQAWCPLCLEEWLENRKVIYLPLLWALNVVKVCPYHHQPLQSQCPHCHAQFLPLWRSSRPGYCLKCSGWLGSSKDARDVEPNFFEATDEFQWNIWAANTLGNLIAQAPSQHSPLPRETIKKALVFFVNKFSNGDVSAFGQLIGVPSSHITQWYSGKTIPTLDKLLKICYRLQISLIEFLQPELKQQVNTNQVTLCPSPQQRQLTVTSQRNKARIRSLLKSVLNQNEYPSPSVREVARRYHIGGATLYRYAPDLCQAISARYWDYKKLLQQQTIQQGINEVKRLAPELYAQGITPSVKNLASVMTNPEALWREEVLETLSEVRRSLGELPE